MTLVVAAPDIELWACDWLRAALEARTEEYATGVFVATKVPDPRRDRMVTVRRDGGPRQSLVLSAPRLGVNVWATTEQDVTDLSRLVAALLWSAPDGQPVCRVDELSGPSPVEDVQPRRYMTFDLTVRGTER
jgi:hypothetical protein